MVVTDLCDTKKSRKVSLQIAWQIDDRNSDRPSTILLRALTTI